MIYDYKNGIYGIDSFYAGMEARAMIYVITSNGRATIIDTANNEAISPVLDATKELGLSCNDVDYICLTHVHLDHAGGAWLFMERFPNAKLVVQKRGVRHMINPQKLYEGVQAVYGSKVTEQLYGELIPISGERILAPDDGDEVVFGGRTLVCLEAPGHAKHHMIFHDPAAKAVFTGDTYGISYRELGVGCACGVVITTSPTQFDPDEMHRSIERIRALNPERLYLTHFGELMNLDRISESLHRQVDAHADLALKCGGNFIKIREGLVKYFQEEALIQDWLTKGDALRELFNFEINLSAKGLQVWYDSQNNL